MNDLRTVSGLVTNILENNPQARNSDSFLYLKVLEAVAERDGVTLNNVTVHDFLTKMYSNFPGFETVRRSRQKVQEKNPALRACETVTEYRAENEKIYRSFARGDLNG